ncbi:MAG TPA: TonB-dependent receptor [Kofleriaceae bacterium]
MQRRVVIGAALALASGTAQADDPRDIFGLKKPPKTTDVPDCADQATFGCAQSTDPFTTTSPYALSTWLSADYLERLPVADSTVDQVAHWATGASRDDVGVSFGGATGLENRWTVEGAPVDNVRSGVSELRVPLSFVTGIRVTAGGFSAADRTSLGGTIDATLVKGGDKHEIEARIYGGVSADSPQKPRAAFTYSLYRLRTDDRGSFTGSVVAKGPLGHLAGGKAWYAAGIAPSLSRTSFQWTASRLVDQNDDGTIDGLPFPALEPIEKRTVDATDYSVPYMARVGWDRGVHHVDLTLIGQVDEQARFLTNASAQAAGTERRTILATGIATWHGDWAHTHARVQLSWQRSDRDDHARDGQAANMPQLLTAYVPTMVADDPQVAQGCNDNRYPQINQCPLITGYYASGGAGTLVHSIADRPVTTAEISHQVGNHVLKAGGTFEDALLRTTSTYTGGQLVRSLFDGHVDAAKFYFDTCSEDASGACSYRDSSTTNWRARYAAAYAEDTWSPQPNIRIDGGLRYERMTVEPQLKLNGLAPRTGISWDFLGNGMSRAFASMGRSYAYLPAGLGETITSRDRIVHDVITGQPGGHGRTLEDGSVYIVADGTEPMAQDELLAGIQVGLANAFLMTGWVQGRYLRRGLETTPEGFINPGSKDGDPAIRTSEQGGVEVATSPTARTTVRVGWMYGRTVGNFAGPYDPQTGAGLYDSPYLNNGFSSPADYGRLPTDPGHRFYFEGDRVHTVGPVQLHLGIRMTAASGRPRNVYGDTDVGFISLIARGDRGRTPMTTQANLRLGARWKGFDLTLDLFNIFDRGTATGVDDYYTSASVRPIDGGSYEDLVFLKTVTEQPAPRSARYGLPYAYQAPFSAFLGLRRSF